MTTGVGTIVMGATRGIEARNYGTGALTIAANGNVAGTNAYGIYALNSTLQKASGTDLSVTTGAGTAVTGGINGIVARNYGKGTLTVKAYGDVGDVTTTNDGIFARGTHGTDVAVTTYAGTKVTGGYTGIEGRNYGSGTLTVTANGNVTGTNGTGIYGRNYGTDLGVTTGAGTTVSGGYSGIVARNYGSGAVRVTANGDVTGTNGTGINAVNLGTDLTVTTGAGTTVTGYFGIRARNLYGGMMTVNANGDVTGTYHDGIYARHDAGGPIAITVGSASHVTSNGPDAGDFAIDIRAGPGTVALAGTLNGGAGGAVRFDQVRAFDDLLELVPSAVMNGNAFGGPETGGDTLALRGMGDGNFDVGKLADFEIGVKDTANHWTLTGLNAEILDFTVSDGILTANGTTPDWAFNVTGATLNGIGTVGALTAGGGGIIAPGNSIGTLTANGNVALGASSTFEVELDANTSDKLVVTGGGTVNLTGSALKVIVLNTFSTNKDYLIIDNDLADPVTGQFANVAINVNFLTPTVRYDAGTGNDVVLTLTAIAPPNPGDSSGASGGIHASIAGILADENRYVREAVLGRLMQATYTSKTGQVATLGASGPQVATLDSQSMTLGPDGEALPASVPGQGLAFWTRAYGAWADFDGNRNAASASRNLGGFLSGVDALVSGTWRAGLAAGFSQSDISVDAQHSQAEVESFNLAGYAGGMAGPIALRGGGAWAFQNIDTSRAIIAPGFFAREKASYDADTSQIFGEAAYPAAMGSVALEPFAGLAFVRVETDSFKEHGDALVALNSRGIDFDVGYSTLGLRAASTMHWNGMVVTPHASAAWMHAFGDVTPDAALTFASAGIGFVVTGVPLAQNSALVEAGLDLNLSPTAALGVSYSGQLASELIDNAVKGRFTWLF